MTSRAKHMKRSHRSYRDTKHFANFQRNAAVKADEKEMKSLVDRFLGFFKETTYIFKVTTNK